MRSGAAKDRLTKEWLNATRDTVAEVRKSLEVVWKGCFGGTGRQGRAAQWPSQGN